MATRPGLSEVDSSLGRVYSRNERMGSPVSDWAGKERERERGGER